MEPFSIPRCATVDSFSGQLNFSIPGKIYFSNPGPTLSLLQVLPPAVDVNSLPEKIYRELAGRIEEPGPFKMNIVKRTGTFISAAPLHIGKPNSLAA
jgi:hypothetical protein